MVGVQHRPRERARGVASCPGARGGEGRCPMLQGWFSALASPALSPIQQRVTSLHLGPSLQELRAGLSHLLCEL